MPNETCTCAVETKSTRRDERACCCGSACTCDDCACYECACADGCACPSCPCEE